MQSRCYSLCGRARLQAGNVVGVMDGSPDELDGTVKQVLFPTGPMPFCGGPEVGWAVPTAVLMPRQMVGMAHPTWARK